MKGTQTRWAALRDDGRWWAGGRWVKSLDRATWFTRVGLWGFGKDVKRVKLRVVATVVKP